VADDLDDLYAADLDEFVARRDDLAKRLRKEGNREAADRVKALRKPSAPAWAANRLARFARGDVNSVLKAGERLERAQKGLLAGKGRAPFDQAAREHQEAVRALVERAGGLGLSEQMLERLGATVRAASTSDEGRALLRQGRLTEDVEPGGFEAFAGVPVTPAKKRPAAAPKPNLRKEREEARALEAEAKAAEREAAKARKEADRLEEAAAAARKRADQARERLDSA
jgi:hypothetical protein